jgi:hypothetical protein
VFAQVDFQLDAIAQMICRILRRPVIPATVAKPDAAADADRSPVA